MGGLGDAGDVRGGAEHVRGLDDDAGRVGIDGVDDGGLGVDGRRLSASVSTPTAWTTVSVART